MAQQKNPQRLGEAVWAKMPKINAEVFTLTYGSLVMQLLKDFEDVNSVNDQLEKMGHNIGDQNNLYSKIIRILNSTCEYRHPIGGRIFGEEWSVQLLKFSRHCGYHIKSCFQDVPWNNPRNLFVE